MLTATTAAEMLRSREMESQCQPWSSVRQVARGGWPSEWSQKQKKCWSACAEAASTAAAAAESAVPVPVVEQPSSYGEWTNDCGRLRSL